MKKFKKLICNTDDGSSTIFLPDLNEYYHSKHGAVSESEHVFIKNGFYFWMKNNPNRRYCNIFEVGFGTGLNAFLTNRESKFMPKINFDYSCIESHPLELAEVEQLNYDTYLFDKDNIFNSIHSSKWNLPVKLSNNFSLLKISSDIQNYNFELNTDIIYFDAFCYRVQPEMWSIEVIGPIIDSMNKSSVFVTYSSMNILFEMLKDLKLEVEKIKGPSNKKKMIRAIKNY